jgi:hypothetical protein
MRKWMEQRENVKMFVTLQKLPTGQISDLGLEIEEFPQAKEAMNVKVQNVDLLFQHQEYLPL